MGDVRRDIYGNAVDWTPTGARRVFPDGTMRAQMSRDGARVWMYCRPHEGCEACTERRDHEACPETSERRGVGKR